jgi:uncharacterized protein (DUF885 family)
VRSLADSFLSAYFDRYPEEVTSYGVPGRRHDRLTDNSLDALKAWDAREDAWMNEVRAIAPSAIQAAALRATLATLGEELEGSIAVRVCRNELWNVSQMTGWHVEDGYLVTIQPVGTAENRMDALARWGSLPHYIDTEIANLRAGIKAGYTAPKNIVRIVVDQMSALVAADSPFFSPAQRDTDPEFKRTFTALVRQQLIPAFNRYRDFLSKEYLPAARESIAITANPDGAHCYEAAVRQHSSLPVSAARVHELGLQQIDALTAEMKAIAEGSFHTSNVPQLLERMRTDKQYLFKNREELIAFSQAALTRAKAATPGWFTGLPKADVRIEPYPRYRERNAPNEYEPPAEDGSRPALFYISAYQADRRSRANAESTAFHETVPGHHLQIATALENKDLHPIGRYLRNGGYTEGWALYAERLADEMKLYSSDVTRLGMLSDQALRASRLVVDSGLHTMGWTRQQAIDYMLTHTTEPPNQVASEVDRYIILPGQATAYMLGMLEIRRAREDAQRAMGARFDIKAFHTRVLEDGAVPLPFLADKIAKWAAVR